MQISTDLSQRVGLFDRSGLTFSNLLLPNSSCIPLISCTVAVVLVSSIYLSSVSSAICLLRVSWYKVAEAENGIGPVLLTCPFRLMVDFCGDGEAAAFASAAFYYKMDWI